MAFKILVVNSDISSATWSALLEEGHAVVIADTPNAALDAAVAHRPDAVVLDLAATLINQFALARALRTTLPAGTPILVLDQAVERSRSDDLGGADLVLCPPFQPAALVPLLASIQKLKHERH